MLPERTRRHLARVCAQFVLALGLADRAWAQDEGLPAREHFERGVEAARRGELELALQHFEQADRQSPNQTVRYNLGQTYTALGRPVDAVAILQRYLLDDEGGVDLERRAEVEELVRQNERRIGTLTVGVTPAGATVVVDSHLSFAGRTTEPLRLAAGRHLVAANHPGFRGETLSVEIAPGRTTEVLLELEPEAATGPVRVASDVTCAPTLARANVGGPLTDRPTAERDATLRAVMYGSGATGVVFAAGALALRLHNSARYEDYRRDQRSLMAAIASGSAGANEAKRSAALNQRAAEIQAMDDLSLAAGVLGAALMATSVVLFVTTKDEETRVRSGSTPLSFHF